MRPTIYARRWKAMNRMNYGNARCLQRGDIYIGLVELHQITLGLFRIFVQEIRHLSMNMYRDSILSFLSFP